MLEPLQDATNWEHTADALIESAKHARIDVPADERTVSDALILTKGTLRDVEAALAARVRPHLDAEANVRAEFRPLIQKLKTAEMQFKSVIKGWQERLEREEREAREKVAAAQAEAQRTGRPVVLPEPAMVERVGSSAGRVSFRKRWQYRLVNITKVPYDYLIVDRASVMEAINKGGVRAIPGLEIYEDTDIAAGR